MNATIEASANNILLEVSEKYPEKDAIVSSINLSPEEIKIQSNKIALEGYTTINDGFSVDLSGNMSCQNADIQGDLNLNSTNYIRAYNGNNKLTLSLNSHNIKFNDNNGNEITNIGLYGGENSKGTMIATNIDHSPSMILAAIKDDGQTIYRIMEWWKSSDRIYMRKRIEITDGTGDKSFLEGGQMKIGWNDSTDFAYVRLVGLPRNWRTICRNRWW